MKNLPRRVEVVILAMKGPHYYKLCGLRMRCHSGVYACEGTQANTFGNKMCIYIKKIPHLPSGRSLFVLQSQFLYQGLGDLSIQGSIFTVPGTMLFLDISFLESVGATLPVWGSLSHSFSSLTGVAFKVSFQQFPIVIPCQLMPQPCSKSTLFISISWFLTQTLLIRVMSELAWLQLQVSYHIPK